METRLIPIKRIDGMEKKAIRELKVLLMQEFKEIAKNSTKKELEKYAKENQDKINLYKLAEVLTSVQLKDVTFLNNNSVDQFGITGFNANASSMPNFADPVAAQDPVTLNYFDNNLPAGGNFDKISGSFNSDVGTSVQVIETIDNNGNPFQIAVDVSGSDEVLFKINNTSGVTLYTSFEVQRKVPKQPLLFSDPTDQTGNYLSITAASNTFLTADGSADATAISIADASDRNKFLFLSGSIGTLTDNVFTAFNVTLQVAPRSGASPFNTILVYGYYIPFGYSA